MRHARKIRCARCGTRLADPSKRIYSPWTKSHYCADIRGCDRRSARVKKLREKAAA